MAVPAASVGGVSPPDIPAFRERLALSPNFNIISQGALISRPYNLFRAELGGIAFGLGCLGLFFFLLAVPFTFFAAHFWGGFGFHECPQPTAAQYDVAISDTLSWSVWHRLVPPLGISFCLVIYGVYEEQS